MSAKRVSASAKKAIRAAAPPPPPASAWQRLRRDPRLGEAAWVLLPLRAFLGVTFLYAGLSKIFDRNYLDASSPLGVRSQMLNAAHGSPISGLVTFSAHHAVLIGLLIAFGEIAAGLSALCGLFTRLAATVGMLLSLSFFLTVSWRTTPYYFGSDIVFLFAWTPLLIAGDGGLFSAHTVIRRRVRERMRLPALPGVRESAGLTARVERRTALATAAVAGAVGAVVAVGGSALALGRHRSGPQVTAPPPGADGAFGSSVPSAGATGGHEIAKTTDVAVGSAKSFTADNGAPAWLLHPSASTFIAVSAVCTHQGCPVQWIGGGFQCPCHGATYDATGQPIGGPANGPLAPIPVTVTDGQVRANS